MTDDNALMIEIGANTDSLASSFLKVVSKASSAFNLVEQVGQRSADKLTTSFANVGGNSSFTLLSKGMAAAGGDSAKLAAQLENVRKTIDGISVAGQRALIQKVQDAGGLKAFASSLSEGATSALVTGGAAFLGFEAIKISLDEITKASKEAEIELARLVKIGADAKEVGIGSTFFQQFTDGSKKLGLEAADLTKILSSLKDAAIVSLGTGDNLNPKSSAQDAIKAHIEAGNLNKGDDGAFDAAKTQEERLRVALSLLSELQAKGATLAKFDLGEKLFGSDFASKLREDEGLIDRLQSKVAEIAAGKGANFIPPEQLETARQLDAQIEDLNTRVINALTPFHNDLRGWQQEELRSTLELKEYWVEIVEVFGKLYSFADSIGKQISSWGNASFFKSFNEMMDRWGLLDRSMTMGPFPQPKTNPNELSLTVTKPKGDTSKPLPEKKDKDRGAGSEATDPIESYIDELKKAAATEEAEARTLGMSNKLKQEATDLAKAKAIAERDDRSLTADETKQVLAQADAYAAAKDKIEAFNKSQTQAKDQAQFFGTQFESSIEKLAIGGGKLSDVFKSFATALEEAALKAAILGQGPLAGLFGTAPAAGATGAASVGGLFGGLAKLAGFAEGGQISGPGGPTSDSIPAMLSHGEFVINAKATQANLPLLHAINSGALPRFATGGMVGAIAAPKISAGGGGGDVHFHNEISVNATGGDPKQNADLASQVSKQVETMINKQVVTQLRQQMRSGNMMSR